MKITVAHDSSGEIVSMAKIGDLAQAGSKFTRAGLVPGGDQKVVEIDLSDEQAARPMREIHASYRVDPATSTLLPKDA
ncbi:MAG: hypothetical protein WAL63_02120 [Solirubrobacteraceae bacterium]